MTRWQDVVAVIAAVGVGAVGAAGVALTVRDLPWSHEPTAVGSAEGLAPESASPSPAASVSATCEWTSFPEALAPTVDPGDTGLPPAREITPEVWECVTHEWTVEVHRGEGAQAMYLAPPAGDLVKLFDLRTDIQVELMAFDIDARLAWTARFAQGDGYQVVQVQLEDGLVIERWGGDAIPASQRWDGPDKVHSVTPVRDLADGSVLWGGLTYQNKLESLFVYEGDGEFRPLAAQSAIDAIASEGTGAVDGVGDPGAEVWLDRDGTLAAVLLQRLADAPGEGDGTGEGDFSRASAGGTWVIVDLVNDQWRLAEADLPEGLCMPSDEAPLEVSGAAITASASCANGEGSADSVVLTVG